jgi:aminopeptidase N
LRGNIANEEPVIGPYGVNKEGSGDMYPKGANLIHTIRQITNDDELFRQILRGLNVTFGLKPTTSKEVEEFISSKSKIDFSKVFDQYLRGTSIPMLEYRIKKHSVDFRFSGCIDGFSMPVKVAFSNDEQHTQWIKPTASWQSLQLADWFDGKTFVPSLDFYINTKKVN